MYKQKNEFCVKGALCVCRGDVVSTLGEELTLSRNQRNQFDEEEPTTWGGKETWH